MRVSFARQRLDQRRQKFRDLARFGAVWIACGLLTVSLLAVGGCTAKDGSLAPKFAMRMQCPSFPDELAQKDLEQALYGLGFDVINIARLAKQIGRAYLSDIKIEALRDGAYLDISSLPSQSFSSDTKFDKIILSLDVFIDDRPSKNFDERLNAQIEEILEKNSLCRVENKTQNGPSSQGESIYSDIVKLVRGHFREAQEMAPGSDAILQHQK